ncbi:MAG TPA: hypothetical protein VJU59_17740 [Paraburkholderia sp.]|uniref:hypothetical protein n=1 Tax=Paraburkholderia sp. TaxID=1926495 RepID=UPI002B466176|nr:hypothetical protein [Paraburkholderia sp.]HKR41489.1 hypothetical protein [Paraburkholderia sp.]
MLSPHEFAILMLVDEALDQTELSGADLEALLSLHLVTRETQVSGSPHFHLTVGGRVMLAAANRVR